MNRNEHSNILAAILAAASDPATVSDKVTQLSDDYMGLLAESEINRETITGLKKQNEELIKQNMKLFLKVGVSQETPIQELEEKRPTFESLFDENGNLK